MREWGLTAQYIIKESHQCEGQGGRRDLIGQDGNVAEEKNILTHFVNSLHSQTYLSSLNTFRVMHSLELSTLLWGQINLQWLRSDFHCRWNVSSMWKMIVMSVKEFNGRPVKQGAPWSVAVTLSQPIKLNLRLFRRWLSPRDAKSCRCCRYICTIFFQLVLIFGPFWQFWVIFGPIWAILGHFWAVLGNFRSFLGHFLVLIFCGKICLCAI